LKLNFYYKNLFLFAIYQPNNPTNLSPFSTPYILIKDLKCELDSNQN